MYFCNITICLNSNLECCSCLFCAKFYPRLRVKYWLYHSRQCQNKVYSTPLTHFTYGSVKSVWMKSCMSLQFRLDELQVSIKPFLQQMKHSTLFTASFATLHSVLSNTGQSRDHLISLKTDWNEAKMIFTPHPHHPEWILRTLSTMR